MELDKDHIHFLLGFKPFLSIQSVVNHLKQISTNHLYKKCESHLRKFYYGKNYFWTRGYFVSTIGEVSEKTLIKYIENQGWPRRRGSYAGLKTRHLSRAFSCN